MAQETFGIGSGTLVAILGKIIANSSLTLFPTVFLETLVLSAVFKKVSGIVLLQVTKVLLDNPDEDNHKILACYFIYV